MILLKNILVATDFGEASDAALRYGRDFARTFGGRIHVLHVAQNLMAQYATEFSFVDFPEVQSKIEEGARQRLEALLDAEDRSTLRAKVEVRTSSSPASAIIAYATDERIDLIITGTHGRGGATHFLLGSVAERVAQTAPCPVLTVRSLEHEFLQPDALATLPKA
jgi:universal stress protein A